MVLPIFIGFFTFTFTITVSILLVFVFMEFASFLGSSQYQITSDFTGIGIDIDIHQYKYILNINLPLSELNRTNKTSNLLNLSLAYDFNSPIFKELVSILTNNPLNQETQLRIEQFLHNQGLELTKLKLSIKDRENPNIQINNALISKLIEQKRH